MTEYNYLIYFPDPYGVGNPKYVVANEYDFINAPKDTLKDYDRLITFDVHTLVDDLRNSKGSLPAELIDISDALRLNAAVSRSDGGEKVWGFWRNIKPHFKNQATWKILSGIYSALDPIPQPPDLPALLREFVIALGLLWNDTKKKLELNGELVRFLDVEVPVAQIFYYRQFVGIPIDRDKVGQFTALASKERYKYYQDVSATLGISATGLSYWNVGSRLSLTDFSLPSAEITGYALRDQMKLATNQSHFATRFTRYLDASRDMDILARLSGESDRVFPTFHPIGTVSSRILIADPYLQELRRKYREVICSEKGMELLYFDYSQFEPGIMAALAGDADLMSLYNQGDIYKALSIAVYGDPEHRQICKRVFLAYSYGMSLKGIAVLLCGKNASEADKESMELNIRQFFERYKSLVLFKSRLEDVLLRDGSVRTLEGNRRQRLRGGKLSSKERRWAVSQVVQGTASLIFKHALINIVRKFGKNALLIPVHDAILMQLPIEDFDAHRAAVVEIMQSSFSRFCPGVSVRVTSGSFHE